VKKLSLALALTLGSMDVAWAQGLEYPVDVALDQKGVVYVADHQMHALLKLEGGAFQVVAKGEGLPRTPLFGIRHIAPDKQGGWVASDPATMKLYRIDAAGKIAPVPDDDHFVTPWGVAVEASGDILAVDRVTQRLRRVTSDGKVTDVAQVRAPRAILFDKDGGILVLTDRNLEKVIDGKTEPIIDSPPFEFPHDALLHPNGNYYVTDGYTRTIWQVTPQGEVTALAEGDPFQSPQGLAVDAKGNLLVADAHAKKIFLVNAKGEVTVLAP
jgi:sugar lactone lactonase YvrE